MSARYATQEEAVDALMADVWPVLADLELTQKDNIRWRSSLFDVHGDYGALWVELDPYPRYGRAQQYEPKDRPYRLSVPTARQFYSTTLVIGSKETLIARLREHFTPEVRATRRAEWAAEDAKNRERGRLAVADKRLRDAAPALRDALIEARQLISDPDVLARVNAALAETGDDP